MLWYVTSQAFGGVGGMLRDLAGQGSATFLCMGVSAYADHTITVIHMGMIGWDAAVGAIIGSVPEGDGIVISCVIHIHHRGAVTFHQHILIRQNRVEGFHYRGKCTGQHHYN